MAGIYIHIPFCKKRCTYCDFHFVTNFEKNKTAVIDAISREIQLRKKEVNEEVETIYFGGGTPSLLTKEELTLLLDNVFRQYKVNKKAEITLEANPDDCSYNNLQDWFNVGINRLSIGIQTFKEEELIWMNRSHSAIQATQAVENARKVGFSNISLDLIYGIPSLSEQDWLTNLSSAVQLQPNHISAYCLIVEPKTKLYDWSKKNIFIPLNEKIQNQQFIELVSFLESNGYEQYEIASFAKNEVYSKHNSSYWMDKPYLGFGPSAHSYDRDSRRWNISNNASYVKNVGINECWYEKEHLNFNDKWNELFLTGLRTKWGVNKVKMNSLGDLNSDELQLIEDYTKNGSLIENDTALILTQQGKLYADGIASSFFRVN